MTQLQHGISLLDFIVFTFLENSSGSYNSVRWLQHLDVSRYCAFKEILGISSLLFQPSGLKGEKISFPLLLDSPLSLCSSKHTSHTY